MGNINEIVTNGKYKMKISFMRCTIKNIVIYINVRSYTIPISQNNQTQFTFQTSQSSNYTQNPPPPPPPSPCQSSSQYSQYSQPSYPSQASQTSKTSQNDNSPSIVADVIKIEGYVDDVLNIDVSYTPTPGYRTTINPRIIY